MTVLKAIANTLLSLLLFLCLTVMGIGVTVNSTALSSNFVTTQVNRFDIAAYFNEEILPELQEDEEFQEHPELIASLQKAVTENAPAAKTAFNLAVTDIYAYMTGDASLNLKTTLKNSIFDPELSIAIMYDTELKPYIANLFIEALPQTSVEIGGFSVDLTPYADPVAEAIQPAFKAQAALLIPVFYEYMLGDSAVFDFSIPTAPIVGDLRTALKSAVLADPPPSLSALSPSQLSLAFDTAWPFILPEIPANISLDSTSTGFEEPGDIRADVRAEITEVEEALAEGKEWIGYYKTAFWALIGFIALIILAIALINRSVKANCRILGGAFLTYGAFEAAGILISRAIMRGISLEDVPGSLSAWLLQFAAAASNPLLIFSIVCAVIGVTLFIVSFLYHPPPDTA